MDNVEKAVVVTGIVNPKPMQEFVSKYCEIKTMVFPDHYNFRKSDITKIGELYKQFNSQKSIILTTEKDAMRLIKWKDLIGDMPIYYLPIEVKIHQNDEHNFDRLVSSIVKENISFLDKLKQTPIGKSWC